MKLLGATIAILGAFYWVWPEALLRTLEYMGVMKFQSLSDLLASTRVMVAIPSITIIGVVLFVGGHITDTFQACQREDPRLPG